MANSATRNKIKKSEYQDYADCIRSDQVLWIYLKIKHFINGIKRNTYDIS